MVNFTIIILLLGLVIGSLLISRAIRQRQEERTIKNMRLRALIKRVGITNDVVTQLEVFENCPELVKTLCQSVKVDIEKVTSLDPEYPGIKDSLSELLTKEEKFEQAIAANKALEEGREGNPQAYQLAKSAQDEKFIECTTFNNDKEIADLRLYIRDAREIMRRLRKFKKITSSEFNFLTLRLRVIDLYIQVNSYVRSGDLAQNVGDKVTAMTFYRQAQDMLQASPIPLEEKSSRLTTITSLLRELFHSNSGQEDEANLAVVDQFAQFDAEMEEMTQYDYNIVK